MSILLFRDHLDDKLEWKMWQDWAHSSLPHSFIHFVFIQSTNMNAPLIVCQILVCI